MTTVQTLKGFRDFLPEEKKKRDWVTKKIVEVFERFGFEPLETPTLEYASLLLGKYGEEADKLVYSFNDRGGRKIALRYDQTVPTARVLAQNQNPKILPTILRRYQIQNVFRAEKPQKGRYREFTQCDIDIFGSNDPITDAEILACTYFAYKNIGFKDVILTLNDRETLFTTLNRFATKNISVFSIIQSIDKLDKMPKENVIKELVEKGMSNEQSKATLQAIQSAQPSDSLRKICNYAIDLGVTDIDLVMNTTLARGLDYYTGMIFEVGTRGDRFSLAGGGRYNNLIGELSNVNIAAVGMAIGFDRTVEMAEQKELIPSEVGSPTSKVLVAIFDETVSANLKLAQKLRTSNINTEIFGDQKAKLDKQLKYANRKNIPYVAIIGPDEVANNTVTIKDMQKGTQKTMSIEKLVSFLR